MNIQIDSNRPIVNIIDDENNLSFEFISADKNYLVSQNELSARLLMKKQTIANVLLSENILEISFEKNISYIQFISIKFKFDSIVEIHNNYIIFSRGDKDYVIDFQNTKYSFESNDTLLVILDKSEQTIKVSELGSFVNNFQSQSVRSFTAAKLSQIL